MKDLWWLQTKPSSRKCEDVCPLPQWLLTFQLSDQGCGKRWAYLIGSAAPRESCLQEECVWVACILGFEVPLTGTLHSWWSNSLAFEGSNNDFFFKKLYNKKKSHHFFWIPDYKTSLCLHEYEQLGDTWLQDPCNDSKPRKTCFPGQVRVVHPTRYVQQSAREQRLTVALNGWILVFVFYLSANGCARHCSGWWVYNWHRANEPRFECCQHSGIGIMVGCSQ